MGCLSSKQEKEVNPSETAEQKGPFEHTAFHVQLSTKSGSKFEEQVRNSHNNKSSSINFNDEDGAKFKNNVISGNVNSARNMWQQRESVANDEKVISKMNTKQKNGRFVSSRVRAYTADTSMPVKHSKSLPNALQRKDNVIAYKPKVKPITKQNTKKRNHSRNISKDDFAINHDLQNRVNARRSYKSKLNQNSLMQSYQKFDKNNKSKTKGMAIAVTQFDPNSQVKMDNNWHLLNHKKTKTDSLSYRHRRTHTYVSYGGDDGVDDGGDSDHEKELDIEMIRVKSAQHSKPRLSFKERMKNYEETLEDQTAKQRMKAIKVERRASDVAIDETQKRRASELLQEYTEKKVENVRDISLIDQTLKNINKENCLEKLESLGIVSYIHVPINSFDRWNQRNKINNLINNGDDNISAFSKEPTKYVKMAVLTLLNSKVLIKLMEEQKEIFKHLMLIGLQKCKIIYKINFTAANITNPFLNDIINILIKRNQAICVQNKRLSQERKMVQNSEHYFAYFHKDFTNKEKALIFGPEFLFIENNPISDRGIQMICKYLSQNSEHLKCLKAGHCFATISTNLCQTFCDSLNENKFVLKVTFDMRWNEHRQKVDQFVKRNYKKYRNEQKLFRQKSLSN